MKVIDCDWKNRNGNGQSTCHLCNRLTWDSWCFDFELKILDKELFNTVLCDDCISKIKKELECKMVSNEDTKEEKPKHIEKLSAYHLQDKIKLVDKKRDKEYDGSLADGLLAIKINELTKAVNYLLGKDK